MSALRKLARDAARASSYRKEGNTGPFMEEFERIWRSLNGYPEFTGRSVATKTRIVDSVRKGYTRYPRRGRR